MKGVNVRSRGYHTSHDVLLFYVQYICIFTRALTLNTLNNRLIEIINNLTNFLSFIQTLGLT